MSMAGFTKEKTLEIFDTIEENIADTSANVAGAIRLIVLDMLEKIPENTLVIPFTIVVTDLNREANLADTIWKKELTVE